MNPRTLLIALALPIGLALLAQRHPEAIGTLSDAIRAPLDRLARG